MIFHKNSLLADDSHEESYLILGDIKSLNKRVQTDKLQIRKKAVSQICQLI